VGTAVERILLVEDDGEQASLAAGFLQRAGFEVRVASSGLECLRASDEFQPDLTLLDFELPDMDAIEILDQLRGSATRTPTPVLILTGARLGASDEIRGLEHGASDYIVKGIDRAVLLTKIRATIREHRTEDWVLRSGSLVIDVRSGTASLAGAPLDIDRKPLLVLHYLVRNEGRVVSREELLRAVWSSSYEGFERSVDQAIYAARKALGDRRWIQTIPGFGYRFRRRW
jgi:DNA-binding response OmpR family regulator